MEGLGHLVPDIFSSVLVYCAQRQDHSGTESNKDVIISANHESTSVYVMSGNYTMEMILCRSEDSARSYAWTMVAYMCIQEAMLR